jgi:hypothetical protein
LLADSRLTFTGEVPALTLKETVSSVAGGKLIEVCHQDPTPRSIELAVLPTPVGATFGIAGSFQATVWSRSAGARRAADDRLVRCGAAW